MLDGAQKAREASEDDFERLSGIVTEERDKQKAHYAKCKSNEIFYNLRIFSNFHVCTSLGKAQLEKCSEFQNEFFNELFDVAKSCQTLAQSIVPELKQLLQHARDKDADNNDVHHFQDLLTQLKDVVKDINTKASIIQKNSIDLSSIKKLSNESRCASMKVSEA